MNYDIEINIFIFNFFLLVQEHDFRWAFNANIKLDLLLGGTSTVPAVLGGNILKIPTPKQKIADILW